MLTERRLKAFLRIVVGAVVLLAGLTGATTAQAAPEPTVRTCYDPTQNWKFGLQSPAPSQWCQDVFSELAVASVDSGVSVSWKAKTNSVIWGCTPDGAQAPCAITGVRVETYYVDPDRGVAGQGRCTGSISANGCSVGGMKPGQRHKVEVYVDLANGAWLRSNFSAIPCCVVPAAPSAVEATVVGNALDVTWSASKDWGGSSTLSYVVTTEPPSVTCTAEILACRLEGLEYSKAYRVVVKAKNQAGASAPAVSAVSYTINQGPPDAPTITDVRFAGAKAARVSWTPPASTGGLPITKYTVTTAPGGATCSTTSGGSCIVKGLSAGKSYSFTATATNSKGTSKASAPSVAGKLSGPGATVGTPAATAAGTTATITWKAPISKMGGALVSYVVKASNGGGSCTTKITRCSISGLRPGGKYQFSVSTIRAGGASAAVNTADVVVPAPPMPAPPKPTAELT